MYFRRKDNNEKCLPAKAASSAKLFAPGRKLLIKRAPVLGGAGAMSKPFQRPMLKRRAYGKSADLILKQSTLGQKRRMDGMSRLLARAGKGLTYKLPRRKGDNNDTDEDSDEEEKKKEEERPFEPLMLWQSPHNGATPKGLPSTTVQEMRPDEYGVDMQVTVMKPAPLTAYAKRDVFVPPVLAKWLRPHQREGVKFMYDCVMGLKDFDGQGCILADDMGLGKTLQSVALIYTLIKTGITAGGGVTCKRVIVVCPCSLVKNWNNEFTKWLGPGVVKALALAEGDRKTIEKNIDCFVNTKMFNVLIASYECIRAHVGRLLRKPDCCDLIVCDEAHRLKNNENQTSRALNSLPVRRRVLLTGTPMQNDLTEFYAMVDFTNPGILGAPEEFRRRVMFPILRGREPDATEGQKRKMLEMQSDLSGIVEEFILRRINTVNAEHLPPKLVQVVCCNLTDIQANMYQHLVNSKDLQHMVDGKQVNCLSSIQMLMKLSNHPSLVVEDENQGSYGSSKPQRRAAKNQVRYCDDEKESTAAPGADGIAKFLPIGSGRVHPEWSGKMFVLYRLMKEMRQPYCRDKIVIISNYTQTLDLIGRMCKESSWGFCRLDGSVSMKKRQKMVDDFNDPGSSLIAFLLSSKAGGCGLNLIGGNRLVLFDPDWNPAVDKQAAARCWRDGQKKRCFTYRFLATGTVEEKIFQRQLSKEGLQSVVDDKEQVNTLSTKDLRNLFKLRQDTPSDTHDKLRCERCQTIQDSAEAEALELLPKKMQACRELLEKLSQEQDAQFFLKPIDPTQHGRTKEEYEKLVKQPMDLETIRKRMNLPSTHGSVYQKPSEFSKDINRIFTNVFKVWDEDAEIVLASKRLQAWWMPHWVNLAQLFMEMKSDAPTTCPAAEEEAAVLPPTNNSRGEDYQEQIGMPDEENMRHWSHHHSVDTVDDPVFRAAMKGTESVSFVFGLEVTWSLIQQRQQEEEERLALEALENADDVDCEPAKTEGSDSEEEDTKPSSSCELRHEDDAAEMNDFIEDDESKGDDEVAEHEVEQEEDDDDEESLGNANGAEPLENTNEAMDLEEDSDSDDGGDGEENEQIESDSVIGEDTPAELNAEQTSDNENEGHNIEIGQDEEELSNTEKGPTLSKASLMPVPSMEQSRDINRVHFDENKRELDDEPCRQEEERVLSETEQTAVPPVEEATSNNPDPSDEDGVNQVGEDEEPCARDEEQSSPNPAPLPLEACDSNPNPPTITTYQGEWPCSACTFLNKKSYRKCRTCGTKKPSSAPTSGRKRSRMEAD